jgi:probable selenium-dependent hydroxylase accessory protein YqeC
MSLLDTLGIGPREHVALVGAGGKTTLAHRLLTEAHARGWRTLFTSSTHVWQPAAGTFDVLALDGDVTALSASGWRSAFVAGAIAGEASSTPVPGAAMPTILTKRKGLPSETIDGLSRAHPEALLLVEADGARGLRIKAPGPQEPVIPACTELVLVLANLNALGRPLDDRIAFRVDTVAALTRTLPGAIITEALFETLLTHPNGGMKNIPAGARRIAVLTGGQAAPQLCAALIAGGFDAALTLASDP